MILPEYVRYWGLSRLPFSLTPDPSMLYLSRQHRECLLRLQYAVLANKGGALLVSENAGDGKTTVLRRLVEDLSRENRGLLRVAFISHPTLTANQFITEIGRQMGIAAPPSDKMESLNLLREHLTGLGGQGYQCVVIVDEGQMLAHRPDILQEFRILLNLCQADAFLLTLILSGQKPLEEALRKMPEFWQRLSVRFFLKNLDAHDTRELVRHRLARAGAAEGDLFTPVAYEKVHRYSEGVPRVICSLADVALVVGASARVKKVGEVEVTQAYRDMEKGEAGGDFHYFHFLRSSEKREHEQTSVPDALPVPVPEPVHEAQSKSLPVPVPAPPAMDDPGAEPESALALDRYRCPFCQEENDPGLDSCGFCGEVIPVELDAADFALLAQIDGADELAADFDRVAVRRDHEFDPSEAGLAYLRARDGTPESFRHAVERTEEGTAGDGSPCRILLTTRRLHFVRPGDVRIVLALEDIQTVRLSDRGGRRILSLSSSGCCHRVLFELPPRRAEVLSKLLAGYLIRKASASRAPSAEVATA
ncbi:MAG: AAA family ATPase [Planctomycetes bacterium]|nr:AAA family ATPase [Planctomycetota bacterium]